MDTYQDKEALKKVAVKFGIGKIENCERLSGGIINDTFKLTTSKGVFVAQRMHGVFNGSALANQHRISRYLRNKGFLKIPEILERSCGSISIKIKNKIWKVLRYIEHDKAEKTQLLIIEAAKTLGEFHCIFSNYAGRNHLRPTILNFHKTKKIIERLHELTKGSAKKLPGNNRKYKNVQDQADLILEQTPKYYLPRGLPTTIIHGDPKFENFLFKNGEVAAIIDMDTLMSANELIDIGDAMRNWSINSQNEFEKGAFDAALRAYLSENKKDYIDGVSALKATALMTLELAARFLIDHFEETHFQWNPEKYPTASAHNLERCNKVLRYYQSLDKYL